MDATAASYAHCQRLARRAASSFYFSFRMLPAAKRRAMCALYAFLRRTDDIGDGEAPLDERRRMLDAWRTSLDRALAGEPDDASLPALVDTVSRYQIPRAHLAAVIDGVEMDLEGRRYETFDDLAVYCRRVASAVGLACIHVWGFHGEGAFEPAERCGLAFQLTNILRDLKEDARRGRVYLPQEDLRRFGCSEDDLRRDELTAETQGLVEFEIERAARLYDEAAVLDRWLEPDGRRVLGAMTAAYRSLLEVIRRRNGDVFSRPVHIGTWRKLRIAARWMLLPPRRRRTRLAGPDALPVESSWPRHAGR